VGKDEFAALYRQHRSALVWHVMCLGASQADAADAVQDAFAYALRAAEQVRDHRAWPAWLRTVAARCYLRSAARRGVTVAEIPDTRVAGPDDNDGGWQREFVLSLLAALPPKQRHVFALHYEGLSTAEIAAQLGLDQAAVRQNVARARASLKRAITQGPVTLEELS
jgi:RNA polymerase sigma factor (sigma-70 family)